MAKKRAKALRWEYCECGCNSHYLNVGPLCYWMFNDLDDFTESFYLRTGHKFSGEDLGCYPSFAAANRAARDHAKPRLKKLRQEITRAARAL